MKIRHRFTFNHAPRLRNFFFDSELPYASKECDRHDLDVRKYACARTYLPFSPTKQFCCGRKVSKIPKNRKLT